MRTNFLKRYWWIILIVVFTPLIINWLILRPAFFKIVGEDTDWLGFWGAYIGTILSSVIAFYVLHKQLEQNHVENRNNRNLQISILIYQTKSQWLTELKSKMVDFYNAFSQNDIIMLGDCFKRYNKQEHILTEIRRISEKMRNADFTKGLLLPKIPDYMEYTSIAKLKIYTEELYALLEDLNWLAYIYTNDKFIDDRTTRKNLIQNFKKRARQYLHTKSKRNWDLIDLDAERISLYSVANQRINEGVNNMPPENITQIILELIDHEQEKINKIILNNNGTKQ